MQTEALECENIKTHAKHYHMDVDDHCIKTNEEFLQTMSKILQQQSKYDYIYLSSHGNSAGFSSDDEAVCFSWEDFGNELCVSECLKENCIVMLSCCRAGLNNVAYELFLACGQIDYVIGPRQKLSSVEMINAFNIIMFNIEHRDIDPVRSCKKVEEGIDIRLMCFDREETTETYSYKMFFEQRFKEFEEYDEKTNLTHEPNGSINEIII